MKHLALIFEINYEAERAGQALSNSCTAAKAE